MENNSNPSFITTNFIRLFGNTEQKQKQAEKYYNLLDKTPEKIELLSGKISNFIDADTVDIQDEQGNINRYRLNTGINGVEYDAIDDKETILNNPNKYKTQVPLLEKVFNKPFSEITDEDIQNYKNYQNLNAINTYGLNTDNTFNLSLPFNPTQQYNFNPEIYKGMKVQYQDLGNNVYDRKSGIIYNPLDYKQNTKSLASNEYQNTNLDLIKLDKLYNQVQIDNNIKPFKEAEQTLGQYWKDIGKSSLASINRSLYGLYKVAKTNNIPIAGLWDWLSEQDIKNGYIDYKDSFKYLYENPELAELTFKLSNNVSTDYIKANEKKMNSIMDSFNKGKYLDAIGKGITAIPDVLATSIGDLTLGAVTGGTVSIGLKVGGASNLANTILRRSVATGAMSTAQLGNVMNEFHINNGYEMPKEKQLLAFTALSLANSFDILALDKGANWFFKNTIGKQLAKDSSKFSPQDRNLIRKILVTNPIISSGAIIGEGIQENIQGSIEQYFSQNLQDAKTFLQIATSDEQLVEGMLGSIVSGSVSLTGLTIGDTANAIRNKLPKKQQTITQEQQTETVKESKPQQIQRILSSINTDLETLNNSNLTLDELNDIKVRNTNLIQEMEESDILKTDLLTKTEKIISKITLKEKMIKGESLTEIMNDKDYNPEGIKDPEELLLKLYYYSDKNNKEEQQAIENLAKKANIDVSKYKNYDQVDLEAKFGERGYFTYRNLLKYYNKQLKNKSLTKENREIIKSEISKVENNLQRFTKSQYDKLNKIVKATTDLRKYPKQSIATYEQTAYDNTQSDTRKEAFVKREEIEKYSYQDIGGIYKIITATIKNLEDSYNILDKNTKIKTDIYRQNFKKLRNTLNGNIKAIKNQSKKIKDKEQKNEQITSKTNTEKQIPTKNRTDRDKQVQQEMVSKEQDRRKREDNKTNARSTKLVFNKTLEEKDTNTPKEEKVPIEAKSEAKKDIKKETKSNIEETKISVEDKSKTEKYTYENKEELDNLINNIIEDYSKGKINRQQTFDYLLDTGMTDKEIKYNLDIVDKMNTIQEPVTIDEKEEIIEQQPSTFIPNEDNDNINLNLKEVSQPKVNKELKYEDIVRYTEEELNNQMDRLYSKDDITIEKNILSKSEFETISDLTYNVNFSKVERDSDNKPIRIRNKFVPLKDKNGNVIKIVQNNFKPYFTKPTNSKSVIRSKKVYEDLITNIENTAFNLFSNLNRVNDKEELFDKYITPELLISQFNAAVQEDIDKYNKELNDKINKRKQYKNEIDELKETRNMLRETHNKIHLYIMKAYNSYYNTLNNSTSESKIKKVSDKLETAIDDFNTKYKSDLDELVIKQYKLDLEDYVNLETKLKQIKLDYTDLNNQITKKYDIYNKLYEETQKETNKISKEIRKKINLIDSSNIQNKLKNTYINKSMENRYDNSINEVKTVLDKLKVSNTKKSLFSMFTIDKNHPEVQKVFNNFINTIHLNTNVSTLINRIKTEPALALLFKELPETIDNKELKYMSKEKLQELTDFNVIMAIDYAVATLFSIHHNMLVYNAERADEINNKTIKELVHSKKQVTKTMVEDKLGDLIVDILGISVNKEIATENDWRTIKANLGLYAFNYALQKGYLSITKTEISEETSTPNKFNTSYITFVEDITNQYDKEYLKAKYELFGLGNIVNKKDLYTKPIQNKEVKIGKGYNNQEVSTLQEMAHEQARQTPYYANIENINFILDNKELVKEYLGYVNDLDSISLAEVRIEKEGKNQTIDRSIEMLEYFRDNYDINNPVFFNTFASKNMRFFIDSNTINPQTDKLHRFLFSTVEETELTPFNFDNEVDKLYFAYGLGQAFGIKTDKMSEKSLLDLFNKLTKLSSKDIKEKFINKEKIEYKDITLKVKEVSHFLQGIQVLEQYEDMITAGKNTASIRLLVENDSTTSGVAIKLLSLSLFKTYRQEMEQVGIFLDKDMTINERKENKENLDIYQGVAKDAKKLSILSKDEIIKEYNKIIDKLIFNKNFKFLPSIRTEYSDKIVYSPDNDSLLKIYSFFKDLLPEIDKDGNVTDELREIFKTPVMTYFYMVGLSGMITDLSETLSIKLFSEYTEAKNKDINTLSDRDKLIVKNIEEFFNFLEVAYVKGIKKSQIKDKSILELLSLYKFDDIVLKNYNMSLNELFTSTIGVLYGGTIWNALHDKYKALRGSNILIGLTNNIFMQLLNELYTKFDLKNKSIKEVEKFLAGMFYPSIPTPYSANKYQGIVAIDKDTLIDSNSDSIFTVLSKDNLYTKILNKEKELITNKPNDSTTATMGTSIGNTVFTGKTTGLPVIMTHSKDGAIINLVMSLFKNLLTVHDATVYQANLGKDIVYNYNKSFYEVVTNYNDYSLVLSALKDAMFVSDTNEIKLTKIALVGDNLESVIALLSTEEVQNFKPNLLQPEQKEINTLIYTYNKLQEIDKELKKENLTKKQKNNLKAIKAKLQENLVLTPTRLSNLLSSLSKITDYQHKSIQASNLTVSNMDGIRGTQYNNQIQEETVIQQVKDKTEEFIKENIKIELNEDGVEEFKVSSKIKKLDPDILKYFDSTIEDDNNVLETRLLTNGEERINLFEELSNKFYTKNNEFKNELKELLSNLNSLRLDNLTVDLINNIKEYGEYDITNNKIVLAANETSPELRYSNPAIRYVHEIVHAVTAFALENSKKLKIDSEKNKLLYLYQLASKHIKPEDFLPEISINREEEIKKANEIWNYIFRNNDRDYPLRGLNEFIAYALTDERIANKLKTIKIQNDKVKKSFKEIIKELVKKIFNIILPSNNSKILQQNFPNLYNFITSNAGFKNQDIHASLLALIQRISRADNKALNNKTGYAEALKNIIEGMKQHIYEPLNTTLSNTIKYITTIGDKTFNLNEEVLNTKRKKDTFKTKELLGITAKTIAYSLISSKARNALPSVLSMYGIGSIGETFRGWGTIGRWINEIKGNDELGNRIQDYNRKARQIDQQAMGLNQFYTNMLIDGFKDKDRPEGLNEIEKVALTDVILKTDLQSLDLDINKIKQLLTNNSLIENELNKQLDIIKKQSRNINDYNYYKNNITLLSYYMNTGNINSLTTLTAKEIADKAGTSTRFAANKILIDAITKATTLLALKNTSLEARQLVSSFNTDGLNFYIKSHQSYVKGASTEINSDTYIGRSKGYTKELIDNAHDIRIGLLSDKDKMLKKGFKPISNEIIGSIGEDKLIVYKDGYKYNQHRNGATFMYTGYAKLGTNMYDYIESEKELINKDINVRNKSAKIRKIVENDRVFKTKQLEKREFKLDELIKLGEKTKGILTIYDEEGNINDYSFIMSKDLSKSIGLNEDGLAIVAKMNASLFRQQQSITFNEELFEFLITLQDNLDKGSAINYKTNYRWVAIDNNTPDKFINNTYKATDKQFKQLLYKYKSNNGFKPLLVREDLVLDLFGQADISLASKISRNHYIMKSVIDLAERIIKFIASNFKTLIVIKTPIVLLGNIMSNISLHALQGINPIQVIQKYINGFKYLQSYKNDSSRKNELLIKENTIGITQAEKSELRILETKLKQNPIYPLMAKGFLSNIVDDITIVNYDNSSDFNVKISKLKSKLPKPLQSIIDLVFLTENTMFYQVMTKATQYSDFLARFVDYEFYMNKAKEKYKGKDLKIMESKIVDKVIENYINYDKPHSSLEQYVNDMGLVLFTKYLKRIQSVITRFIVDKPINTVLFIASQLFLIDTSDIFESSLLFKDLETYTYNPINNVEELLIPPISRL